MCVFSCYLNLLFIMINRMFLTVACVHFRAKECIKSNMTRIAVLMHQASLQGADVIVFPEVSLCRGSIAQLHSSAASRQAKLIKQLCKLAKQYRMNLFVGLVERRVSKFYNSLVAITASGELLGVYRKQHLFRYTNAGIDESLCFSRGNRALVVKLGAWRFGLSICFDVRFASLYEYYRKKLVDVVLIPSAFTYETGKQHWDLLTRTRALDSQAYVIAPNQYGYDSLHRRCYGHSRIVDPFGQVICEALSDSDEIILTKLSKKVLVDIREHFVLN